MRTLIVIPARLGSWRFPEKPLTIIDGMPMIEHVYRRSLLAKGVEEVVMAVCEDRVLQACEKFGAKIVMTSTQCPSAVDRVAEAARQLGYVSGNDLVLNVQGDEPAMPPPVIELTIEKLKNDPSARCANLIERITDEADLQNHHRIKAVISRHNRLIYLTRQAIPASVFDVKKRAVFYRQTCVIGFRGDFLQEFTRLERTPLELIEGIDMLRAIEHDLPIASGVSEYITQPVDTPEDIGRVIALLKNDPYWQSRYSSQSVKGATNSGK
ncbi:MAG: 3-deoxy-manno-octulosonate cytidylyltransferase [Candidatus Margulisiibacteriota bacterium]